MKPLLILASTLLFVSGTDPGAVRDPTSKLQKKLARALYGSDGDSTGQGGDNDSAGHKSSGDSTEQGSAGGSAGQCGEGWVNSGARCYYCPQDLETRDKSAKICRALDADLPCVRNSEQNDALGTVANLVRAGQEVWIGYRSPGSGVGWGWTPAGCDSTYTAWDRGEPSGSNLYGPLCAGLQISREGTLSWFNRNCDPESDIQFGNYYCCEGTFEASRAHPIKEEEGSIADSRGVFYFTLLWLGFIVCWFGLLFKVLCGRQRRSCCRIIKGLPTEEQLLESIRKAFLSQYPALPFRGLTGTDSEDASDVKDCPVCLITFEAETTVRVTKCGHIFCASCLEIIAERSANPARITCPLCRTALGSELIDLEGAPVEVIALPQPTPAAPTVPSDVASSPRFRQI